MNFFRNSPEGIHAILYFPKKKHGQLSNKQLSKVIQKSDILLSGAQTITFVNGYISTDTDKATEVLNHIFLCDQRQHIKLIAVM